MKGLLPAVAVLGVLAIGGLPVLALTLADDETRSDPTVAAVTDRDPGPPPWAHGRAHGRDKPPGWGKHHVGGSSHGRAMREWAHCLADAAGALGEGEKLDPEQACGARPTPPGKRGR